MTKPTRPRHPRRSRDRGILATATVTSPAAIPTIGFRCRACAARYGMNGRPAACALPPGLYSAADECDCRSSSGCSAS